MNVFLNLPPCFKLLRHFKPVGLFIATGMNILGNHVGGILGFAAAAEDG